MALDEQHRLIPPGRLVLDLGCWPGGWLQDAAERVGPTGRVVGVDLTAVTLALPKQVTVLKGDIYELAPEALLAEAGDLEAFDVVLSDMAPHTSGIRFSDVARSIALVERALTIARETLVPGGSFEGLVCSSMGVPFGACLRPAGTAFGVNANVVAGRDAWWLLGYLNSSLVTYLVKGVLRRANMVTAGYVARVPLPALDASCRRGLARAARRAYRLRLPPERLGPTIHAIDSLVEEALGLMPETVLKLREFAADPVRRA